MLLKNHIYSICVQTGSCVTVAFSVFDSFAFLLYRGPFSPAASLFSYFLLCQYVHARTHTHTHTHTHLLRVRLEVSLVSGICFLHCISLMRLLPVNYTPTAPNTEVCGFSLTIYRPSLLAWSLQAYM